jgi:tetratricopeptide (TPR) repeat protein
VLAACTAKLGADHPNTLATKNNLAALYNAQRKYDQAESLYKEALDGQSAKLRADHPDTLASKINLALLYQAQRKYDRADRLLNEAHVA